MQLHTKLILSLLFLLTFHSASFSQSGWFWQNPLPQGNDLNSVKFINLQTGFAVGNAGTILRTTNSGNNWVLYNSNFLNNIYSIAFSDPGNIFAVGSDGLIIKSNNSGLSWMRVSIGLKDTLRSVYFYDVNTGFITGTGGKILKTTNGGDEWTGQLSGVTNNLNNSCFINPEKGFAFGEGKLLRTTNGGTNWTSTDYISTYNSMCFINANTGFIAGGFYPLKRDLRKTTNGGDSWIVVNVPFTDILTEVQFANSSTGFVCGKGNVFLKTTNGGSNWTFDNTISEDEFSFNSVNFPSANEGYLVGSNGTIFKSTNSGNHWTLETSIDAKEDFTIVDFPSVNTGYALGSTIYKTTNAGSNWINLNHNFDPIFGGQFIDDNSGFIQVWPDLLKTLDGGMSWYKISRSQDTARNIQFIDASTGFYTIPPFSTQALVKTTNAGTVWTEQSFSPLFINFYQFLQKDLGFLVLTDEGSYHKFYKTTDLGINWTFVSDLYNDTMHFQWGYFVNENLGFLISSDYFTIVKIFRTTDGGINWEFNEYLPTNYCRIKFFNNEVGIIKSAYGVLKRTTNGGEDWIDFILPADHYFIDMAFTDPNTGYGVGNGGLIMKTTNGGVIGIENTSSSVPSGYMLSQNFPNPFNPNTIISYELPYNDYVTLKVFDILGKEIMTLVNEDQRSGSYNVEFKGENLPSGIYFYKLIVNDFTETRKMVLLK